MHRLVLLGVLNGFDIFVASMIFDNSSLYFFISAVIVDCVMLCHAASCCVMLCPCSFQEPVGEERVHGWLDPVAGEESLWHGTLVLLKVPRKSFSQDRSLVALGPQVDAIWVYLGMVIHRCHQKSGF